MHKILTLILLCLTFVPSRAESRRADAQYTPCTTVCNAPRAKDLATEAQRIADILRSGRWTFVPTQANMPRTITFNDLDPKTNYFVAEPGRILAMVDYHGARVTHSLSDIQITTLLQVNPEVARMINVVPNFFSMEGEVLKADVKVSKSAKTVTLRLKYRVTNSNYMASINQTPLLTLTIETRTGVASLNCRGMHFDESYTGTLLSEPKAEAPAE